MTKRNSKEILVGSMRVLDYLHSQRTHSEDMGPHPQQELVEEVIMGELTDDEREIFYYRFGEKLSLRQIARIMGWSSHSMVQNTVERIKKKVRQAVEQA